MRMLPTRSLQVLSAFLLPFLFHNIHFSLRVLVNVNGCSFLFQRSSRDTVLCVDGYSWVRAACKAHRRCLRDESTYCGRGFGSMNFMKWSLLNLYRKVARA